MLDLLLPAAAPLVLLLASIPAFMKPGPRPAGIGLIIQGATGLGLLAALGSAIRLALMGPATMPLDPFGILALRLDLVSVAMMVLIAFIGFLVVRFAATCMDGEARQGAFAGWLLLALASSLAMVLAGSLPVLVAGWIATSVFLHRLLLHYPKRAAARRAARKKFLLARLGDASLVAAAILLMIDYRTADLGQMLARATNGEAGELTGPAVALLAAAALLKSAQFPFHGWLVEAMETPTPVSALLHAGIINAGGFLLIRMADILILHPLVLALLVAAGGFTALYAGVVMLTQPAAKTQLAWSTVAQMGFMILQCGLALFPLALLHIVAHSLYKAHAFLESGRAVDHVQAVRRPGPVASPSVGAVLRAFAFALALYLAIGFGFGFDGKSPQAIAMGLILVFGTAYLVAQGLAQAAPRPLALRILAATAIVSLAYFGLHAAAQALTEGVLPTPPQPGPLEWLLMGLALVSFAMVAFLQSTFPNWAFHPVSQGARVHFANGLYVNALLDRFIGGWRVHAGS